MARTRPARARISPRSRSKSSPATVLVASDWAPIRAFEPIARDAPASIYGDLLPVLRRADLRIVNCECALASATAAVWKSGAVFKGEPAHVAGLTAVPFDIACLANNHVLDYGVAGLRETLRVLARAGIHSVGAGLTEAQALAPLSVLVNGQPIHIVNLSEGEDLTASTGGPGVFGWDIALAAAQTRALKKIGGVVIVIAHGGLEYVPFPPPYVVAAFRALIEAGADCVIGHHPHVPQGIEWWLGRPIVYSLGNFVFYQSTTLHHRKTGFCVSLQCEGGRVTGIELHPYRITDTGLRRLDAKQARAFGTDLTRLSRPFATAAGPARAWNAWLQYYGEAGFRAEVTGILDRMTADPRKGAAMFRNRITTMQHLEHWETFLTRMIGAGSGDYTRADYRLVEEYFSKEAVS
ncbi:MAG: CapA family protein [Vicinamibacterales bacterium]|jgi:poly-gamma-glutamate synthesis protein (capsule biosynthesis protein)|nr:CapA family protein [Vicinamibacterales bacterium]